MEEVRAGPLASHSRQLLARAAGMWGHSLAVIGACLASRGLQLTDEVLRKRCVGHCSPYLLLHTPLSPGLQGLSELLCMATHILFMDSSSLLELC